MNLENHGEMFIEPLAHMDSKLWRTSLSMNKPTTWCKSARVSLVSSSCLYKTQPERAPAQVCHTRIDALSPDEHQFHLLPHQTDRRTENTIHRATWSQLKKINSLDNSLAPKQATSHYLNQWWPSLLMHINVFLSLQELTLLAAFCSNP